MSRRRAGARSHDGAGVTRHTPSLSPKAERQTPSPLLSPTLPRDEPSDVPVGASKNPGTIGTVPTPTRLRAEARAPSGSPGRRKITVPYSRPKRSAPTECPAHPPAQERAERRSGSPRTPSAIATGLGAEENNSVPFSSSTWYPTHPPPGTSEATFRLAPQRTKPFTIGAGPRAARCGLKPALRRARPDEGKTLSPTPDRNEAPPTSTPLTHPPRDERSDVPVGAPENPGPSRSGLSPQRSLRPSSGRAPTRNGPAWGRGRPGDGGEGKPRGGVPGRRAQTAWPDGVGGSGEG